MASILPKSETRTLIREKVTKGPYGKVTGQSRLTDELFGIKEALRKFRKGLTEFISPLSGQLLSPQKSEFDFISKKGSYKNGIHFGEHVFSLEEVIQNNSQIIIYLNPPLGQFKGDENPLKLGDSSYKTVAQTVRECGRNYIVIPVNSVAEISEKVKAVRDLGGTEAVRKIRYGFMGAVMPHDKFFIGNNPEKLKALFYRLKNGQETVEFDQQDQRYNGLPHMVNLRLKPNGQSITGLSKAGVKNCLTYVGSKINQADLQAFYHCATSKNGINLLARPSLVVPDDVNDRSVLSLEWQITSLDNQCLEDLTTIEGVLPFNDICMEQVFRRFEITGP